MMDWLGKMLSLPSQFLFESGGPGGGVIQGTASEATLVALLSARAAAVQRCVSYLSPAEGNNTFLPCPGTRRRGRTCLMAR